MKFSNLHKVSYRQFDFQSSHVPKKNAKDGTCRVASKALLLDWGGVCHIFYSRGFLSQFYFIKKLFLSTKINN